MKRRFNFSKRIRRNDFTVVFKVFGKRKFIAKKPVCVVALRFKMAKIRRSHQGHCNKTFGSIQALKIRKLYGRRKPVPQFRR